MDTEFLRRTSKRTTPVRALLWRWRWVGLALFLMLAIRTLAPVPLEAEHPVVVAGTELGAGAPIEAGHVKLRYSLEPIPGVITDPEEAVGRYLITALEPGAPLVKTNVIATDFLNSANPGNVIAAVALVSDVGTLVKAGVRVDLWAPGDEFGTQSAELVAQNVLVAAVASEPATSSFIGTTAPVTIYYLEMPQDTVGAVLGASARAPLQAVVISRE